MPCRHALAIAGGSVLAAGQCQAQVGPPPATYRYTAYTVYQPGAPDSVTQVANVGGTLTLRPDSTYEKRLSILFPSGPRYFNQTGRYRLAGDSIAFTFSDLRGSDTQRGTYRYQPATRRLSLTILGYPPGNKGVYELQATPPAPAPRPASKGRQRRPRR